MRARADLRTRPPALLLLRLGRGPHPAHQPPLTLTHGPSGLGGTQRMARPEHGQQRRTRSLQATRAPRPSAWEEPVRRLDDGDRLLPRRSPRRLPGRPARASDPGRLPRTALPEMQDALEARARPVEGPSRAARVDEAGVPLPSWRGARHRP